MSAPYRKVSQVKLDIKRIVHNLQQLSYCNGDEENLLEIKNDTEILLNKLENLPLESIKTKLKKRKRKRHNKKLRKLKILNNRLTTNEVKNESSIEVTPKVTKELKSKAHHHHHQLKSVKECKRFLQTFELLEQLHLARGQNSSETYKFSLKLRQLKTIWNCLLQEKLQDVTSPDVKIQQQWNEVLFGPPEKTYFQDKPDLQDFIRKRQIWDSYIDSKYGTSIPIGWIIPKEEAKEQWQAYLSPSV